MIIENNNHPIERIMDNAMSKIRAFAASDTIIGTPVCTTDGVSIIPVSKVTMGFLTGGGEYSDLSRESYSQYPFAGGSGAGVSVSPVGFLISDGRSVKLVHVDDKNLLEKALDTIPEVLDSLFQDKFGKGKKK
ncbi:MAG: GerW family sporulation protein [Firmicutes bacterium]|nr:GerW family sporulation protein [Bacillota bacterium]